MQLFKGYFSEAHKRKFTMTAGILGALFFIGQFVLPMILFMSIMPFAMMSQMSSIDVLLPERSALWEGQLYGVVSSLPFSQPGTEQSVAKLIRIPLNEDEKSEEIRLLDSDQVWLLSGGHQLWVIGPAQVDLVTEQGFETIWTGDSLGSVTRPFLMGGSPAVISQDPDGFALRIFTGQDWEERHRFSLGMADSFSSVTESLVALASTDGLHLFVEVGDTLYYRQGLPGDGVTSDTASWQVVTSQTGATWTAALLDDRPAVFNAGGRSNLLTGRRLDDGWWQTFFSKSILITDLAVFDMGNPGSFLLVTGGFPGSVGIREIADGKEVRHVKHGSGFPFPAGLFPMMLLPHVISSLLPLVFALILTALMARHRLTEFDSGDTSAPFASLARRAFAQLIDGLILFGPSAVGGILAFSSFMDFESMWTNPGISLAGFGMIFIGLGWAFVCLFVFSATEGAWGVTPGKWIFGIRVLGTDLRPCGFGRAVIRNILKFVDGFMNFMVGVMVVALSENWQRVGDMAARTVVIDVRSGHPEGTGP